MSTTEENGQLPLDWDLALRHLEETRLGRDGDSYIDFLAGCVFSAGSAPGTVAIQMVRLSSSPFTLHRAAVALALTADADDQEAADTLVTCFGQHREDGFLAPALLDAMGVLALKNSLARAELSAILLRLKPTEDRYLLVRAAKVIGRLEGAFGQGDLLGKLTEFLKSDDLVVQAEVRQQLALAEFARVLLSGDRPMLVERLAAARAAFARAQASEEHRPDAAIFVYLLDMLLILAEPALSMSEVQSQIGSRLEDLRSILRGDGPDGLRDYRSEETSLLASRILAVSDALQAAMSTAGRADDWLDIEKAVLDLAAVYALVRWQDARTTAGRPGMAVSAIASAVLAPRLGPVLQRAVGRRKLSLVIEQYRLRGGTEDILEALEALRDHVLADEDHVSAPPDELLLRLSTIAAGVGHSPEELLRQMLAAVQEGRLPEWMRQVGLDQPILAIERPSLYGANPNVDEVVRPLLRQLANMLGDYDPPKWNRLVQVVEKVVSFVKSVRDDLPDYLKCSEDGGLGQLASEEVLKNDLFDALRGHFGKGSLYEAQRIAGGRVDTGLSFDECDVPIETKHTFHSVEPSYIRTNYLPQTDTYAAARDRVAILLVLDLRASNAQPHREVQARGRKKKGQAPVYATYSLGDSFWVDQLPPDPDVPQAKPNALIVGLVPGNQCLPSSKCTYSQRPAKVRRSRKTGADSDASTEPSEEPT